MNSGLTAERVYDQIRRRIMCREFRPGERLDPALLSASLATSVTPVRDALHMLGGEGLVETRAGSGFHLPLLDEPTLQDLYNWSADLLYLSLRCWPRTAEACPLPPNDEENLDLADRTARLFLAVGRCSANTEHGRAIARLNARLHAVRMIEPMVTGNGMEELAAMATALVQGDRDGVRRTSASYHRLRRRAAADIVRAMYRAD